MGLVLDTSILIATERKKFALEEFILSMKDQTVFMSSITLSELWHGCHRGKGSQLEERIRHIKSLEAKVPVLGFGTEEARVHAKIWAGLEKIGRGIGLHDLIIAATALAHDHSVATLNESEFKRVSDIRIIPVREFVLN